jgi:hypothetical protein
MSTKIEDTNTIVSNVVVKKRGRKSKKDIELAQQNEIQIQMQTQNLTQDNINIIIKETDNLLSNDDIIENLINSDDIIENLINSDDEIDLTKDNLETKPLPKKRGRKPKGGKIIQQITPINNNKESKPNVILHLKCSLKDLQTCPPVGSDIQSFNFQNSTHLAYDVINSETTTSNQNFCADVISVSKSVEQEDYDDDKPTKENDIREVWKKLKQLEHNLHTNNICDKKSACFWCTYEFDNPPVYIPKHFIKDSYQVYGCFCSPECATAHLMEENIDSSSKFERYHLINHIYSKIYDYKKNIKPAPNPFYMLEKYYGNLSIQEYRALLKNERLFLIVDKPLTRILPELHEDNDDFIINNKIIPSNTYQIKKKHQHKQTKSNILTERFGLSQPQH